MISGIDEGHSRGISGEKFSWSDTAAFVDNFILDLVMTRLEKNQPRLTMKDLFQRFDLGQITDMLDRGVVNIILGKVVIP